MKEKIYKKISWLLPQRIVFHAFIRFWSFATTYQEGGNMMPDEMTWTKAIELWERKYGSK